MIKVGINGFSIGRLVFRAAKKETTFKLLQ